MPDEGMTESVGAGHSARSTLCRSNHSLLNRPNLRQAGRLPNAWVVGVLTVSQWPHSAGANTVTIAGNTNAITSDWDAQITTATASGAAAPVLPLAVVSGTSGVAVFRITFISATAYVFSRVA